MTLWTAKTLRDPVLLLDCQTTGASPAYGEVLELGWARSDQQSQARVVAPSAGVPARIKKLTGIEDADLEDAPQAREVWQEVLRGVDWPQSGIPVVIHYARFEKPFLDHLSQEIGAGEEVSPICTYEVARRLFPGLPSRSMRAIAGFLGYPMDEFKRAEHHVEATRFIWEKIVPELEAQGVKTFGELVQWLADTKPIKPARTTYALPEKVRLALPKDPGVYLFKGPEDRILYVGKATSLKSRVNSYFRGRKTKGSRLNELRAQIRDVEVRPVGSPLESAILENDLIKQYDPPYNRALRVASRDLTYCDYQLVPGDGPLGPVTQVGTVQGINQLLDAATCAPLAAELGAEESVVVAGLRLYEDRVGMPLTREHLRPLLCRAFVRGVLRDREKILAKLAEDESDEELAEKVDGVVEEKEEEITPAMVASVIGGQIGGLARHMFRVRWLNRLVDCDLYWQEKSWQHLQMREALPAFAVLARKPRKFAAQIGSSYRITELTTFDRLTVLYTEILRVIKRGKPVVLVTKSGQVLDTLAMQRFMFPGHFL